MSDDERPFDAPNSPPRPHPFPPEYPPPDFERTGRAISEMVARDHELSPGAVANLLWLAWNERGGADRAKIVWELRQMKEARATAPNIEDLEQHLERALKSLDRRF